MKPLKNLIVVSERFPSPTEPVFTFVDELVCALADDGVNVTVVSPQSLTRILIRSGTKMPRKWTRETPRGNAFTVYQPWYLSVGVFSKQFNNNAYRRAVKRALSRLPKPDAYYAHFFHSGIAAGLAIGNAPLFIACGESQVKAVYHNDIEKIRPALRGVISVSSKNKADCIRLYGLPDDEITVLPNGVDENLFKKSDDRDALRKRLNLKKEDFVIAFVGWFNERKGVKRLEEAISSLPQNVRALYIGQGDLNPTDSHTAFCGRVEHSELPGFLNAADVFALPTQAEGCCNAIVEAMACGLPIISSQGQFNDDLLDDDRSIRIDPNDVGAIRNAIKTLMNDPHRVQKMGENASRFAQGLSIQRRAERIRDYIQQRL